MRIVIMGDGGRRFTGDDVRFLQADVKEATSALADFAANEYPANTPVIITGVRFTDTGSSITASAGWIHWEGELLQFVPPPAPIGVTGLANVKLYRAINDDQLLAYEDGGSVEVIQQTRYVTLQTTDYVDNDANVNASDRIATADLRRARMHCEGDIKEFFPRPGKQLTDYYDPGTGLGKAGLEGWAICDGRNGTPDKRGRVGIGFSEVGIALANVIEGDEYSTIGNEGGLRSVKLTAGQSGIREHVHVGKKGVWTLGAGGDFAASGGSTANDTNENEDTTGMKNVDGVSGRNGSQNALEFHENRQPYTVVAFFQRIQDN